MSNAKVACGWKCAIKICWLAARYQTGMTPELYWQLHLNFSLQMKLGGNVSFPRGMKRPEMELTTCLPFFSLTHPSKMFPFHTHLVIWKLRSVITWDGGALSSSRSLFFFFCSSSLPPPTAAMCVASSARPWADGSGWSFLSSGSGWFTAGRSRKRRKGVLWLASTMAGQASFLSQITAICRETNGCFI